jgi:hypothetical protein
MLDIKGLARWIFIKSFLSFFITHIFKNNDIPGTEPVLTRVLLFEQSL